MCVPKFIQIDQCQGIRASEEKSGPTKKHKLQEMLDLLCFQSQNLESRGAYEVESLHVLSQSTVVCVCQISSKSIDLVNQEWSMCVPKFIQIDQLSGYKG